MPNKFGKIALAALAGTSIAGSGVLAYAAPAAQAPEAPAVPAAPLFDQARQTIGLMASDKVQGEFAFTQDKVSSNDEIARAIGASKYLCRGTAVEAGAIEVDPADWTIIVKGDVKNAFSATTEELVKKGQVQVRMGCVCAGNDAGGFAVINADLSGVTIRSIAETAQVEDSVNTIVFTSADGYEIALPYSYVKYRHSILVTEVNGAPLCENVGGINQLWLGSTPGSYFSRDVETISFETRQTPPPVPFAPDGDEATGNFPGVGITAVEQ